MSWRLEDNTMTILKPAFVAAILGLAGAISVMALEIKLPNETATYKASELPGYQRAMQKCLICHSADYAAYQPVSSRTYWLATVKKMQKPFGAPLDDTIGRSPATWSDLRQ
jgi:sulfite dehydrogenase